MRVYGGDMKVCVCVCVCCRASVDNSSIYLSVCVHLG